VSLAAGLLATLLSCALALLLGGFSGYHGGWIDRILMQVSDLFLALPWLYLLFAVRALLPLDLRPAPAFAILVLLLGIVGWARPGRLVRGVVLSAKEREFVTAARAYGATDGYILRKHVLPQALGVLFTQAAILIPVFILAEVTLSFVGLGVSEPVPSWGTMLASLQEYHVLSSAWWMFAPGVALVAVTWLYQSCLEREPERALGRWTPGLGSTRLPKGDSIA
jgi:peptide/nickel transport system permease protein